ncbi:MAG: TonB family protein [Myxococcota bacterium]|nr:TonB family protein [Myxococcota bacterium]
MPAVLLGALLLAAPVRTDPGVDLAAAADAPPWLVDALPAPPPVAERLEEIRRRIQEATVYPERARRLGLTGTTRIRFQVRPDGRAGDVETVGSSGSALLDEAAEAGARRARALPYVYGRLEVPVRFGLSR